MKRKKKFVSVGYGAVVAFFAFASISFAAIDYAPVQALITSAVVDVVAGGLILVGAYAGYWGIRKVMELFNPKCTTHDFKTGEIIEREPYTGPRVRHKEGSIF